MSTSELAASYAALILADDGVEITVCSFAIHHIPHFWLPPCSLLTNVIS